MLVNPQRTQKGMIPMRILTIARQVPDSRSSIRVKADGSGIQTGGVKFVCDPFDEFGVEQAIRIKEARSDVEEVIALTFGPAGSDQALRLALAMGADRGIHIQGDDLPLHDEIQLARLAAQAIRIENDNGREIHLVFCGKQSTDNDASDLGPALAELLDWPHAGAITQFELADDGTSCSARRRIEGAEEALHVTLPMLATCEKGFVEPRHPSLPNIIKAKKKLVDILSASDLLTGIEPGSTMVNLAPPPPRAPCRIIEGEPAEMASTLVRLLREEAKVI